MKAFARRGPGGPVHVMVSGVRAGYRGARGPLSLDGVDLTASPGSVTALLGANGAGKTTLIRVVTGFLEPFTGHVRVGGMLPFAFRSRWGVGYVAEGVSLPRCWTVIDLLRAGARLGGLRGTAAEKAVQRVLEAEELEGQRSQRTERLSKGNARRTAFAFALLGRPGLVVLDEPWSGLDPAARLRLRSRIRELAAEERTVILSSHELAEVSRVADRCVVLESGGVIASVQQSDAGSLEGFFGTVEARP